MANPFLSTGPVFAPAQKAAQQRVTKAANALPNRSDLPAKLKQGVTAQQFHELHASSNAHDRQLLNQHAQKAAALASKVSAQVAADRQRALQHLISQGVSARDAQYLTTPSRATVPPSVHHDVLSIAGFDPTDIVKYPFLAGKALVLHPTHVIPATLKGFGEMAAAAPAGVAETVLNSLKHPDFGGTPDLNPADPTTNGQLHQLLADYKRRYSGDFYKRIQKEGLAPEILDAAGIAAPIGKGLGMAARYGSLGETAGRIATEARPALRIGGKMAKEQQLSDNFLRAVAQKGQDVARARRMVHVLNDGRGGDALVQDAASRGQLTPIGLKQSLKKQAAAPEGVLRRERATALQQLLKPYRAKVKKLNQYERAAVKTAAQYGIHTPEQAAAHLPTIMDDILANRQRLDKVPAGRFAKDELPLLEKMYTNPERYFTPKVADTAQTAGDIAHKASLIDPTFKSDTAVARRYAAQGALLKLKRGEVPQVSIGGVPPMVHQGETGVEFARRVKAARGTLAVPLEKPGYFPSEKYPFTQFGAFTRGSPLKAVNGTRQYTGLLRDIGAEHNSPHLFEQGVARNLRHAYNHDAVTKTLANQALPWSVSKAGKPWMTTTQLHEKATAMGLRPDSYVVVRPRLFDKELAARSGQSILDAHVGYAPLGEGVSHVHDALHAATSTEAGDTYSPTQRAVAIPRAVFDELSAGTKPSSAAARKLGAVKGVWSAAMLGTSPSWLPFQVGANALQASLAGAKPWDYFGGKKIWNGLSPTEQQQLGARIGIGNDVHHIERLGSQGGQWAQKWHAVRQQIHDTPVVGTIARGSNIPKHMFKLDELQNNAFRTAVLGSETKKAAYHRLLANSRDGMNVLDKVAARMSTPAGAAKVLKDPHVVDAVAKKVNDFMGDYTSYTSTERHWAQRNIMFYGYLRYSLKFLLQTMPSQRPLVTAALAKFGQLHAEEVHQLLGGDETPWSVGKIFGNGGKTELDLSRLNPFLNAASSADSLTNPASAAIGVLPPYYQIPINQAARQNLFTGTGWKLNGSATPTTGRAGNWRVALADALGTLPPYRIAQKISNPGPQGADSLLFAPRPTQYKRADVVSSIAGDIAAQKNEPLWLRILQQAAPIPRPSKDKITAASIRAKNHNTAASGEHGPPPKDNTKQDSWQQPGAGWGN